MFYLTLHNIILCFRFATNQNQSKSIKKMKKQLLLVVLITTLLSSCSENKNKEAITRNTITQNVYNLNIVLINKPNIR